MASISAAQALSLGADAVHLSRRAPPSAPTGYYDWEVSSDPDAGRKGHSLVSNLVNDIETLKSKGTFHPDAKAIGAFADTFEHPTAVDDRKGAFTDGLGLLARLDPDNDLALKLNNDVVNQLYTTIPHPVASFVGPNYAWRHADGGSNNIHDPDYGRAGTPYARSVQGKAGLPRSSLPDPGLVFDTILKRKTQKNHPGGMSSLIFAYASIVTHSLFRTDQKNIHINNASSYLDLSPLYGDNQADQDKVRNKAEGRGYLYPDTFSEERLLFVPPAASVLLVLFSRNHNYIADKLLKINERKRWSDPPPTDPTLRALQDEEIFQTARLVNGGNFMSSITGDYVASFLGSSEGCNWNMRPFDLIDTPKLKVSRGEGNHCSVEFNILYRWHATIAEKDVKWTEDMFNKTFNNKPFDQLTLADLGQIGRIFATVPANPAAREFAGIKRGPDGKFSDDDLAEILHAATDAPASSYGGRNTPAVLRLVEIMGMEQARDWGLCTMNEFRKFLNLKEFATFEEWNPDPEIAGAARRLYGHIDNLELYTGLQAESIIPLADGFRFSCGYTMTQAVLGDAVALVRGDRFYTTDLTPTNLTTWGYHECQREMNNGSGGSIISKLLIRHLPRHFPFNSVYALWSFFTPEHMKTSLTRQKLQDKYTFDRPTALPPYKILNTFTAIKTVFNDPARFNNFYPKVGYGSPLLFDDVSKHTSDLTLSIHAIWGDKNAMKDFCTFYSTTLKAKLAESSWSYDGLPGKYVDIVKGVIYPTVAHWSADRLTGASLKTKANPHGLFTELEMFEMLATLYNASIGLWDYHASSLFALNNASRSAGALLGGLAAQSILEVSPSSAPNVLGRLAGAVTSFVWPPQGKPWYPFIQRLVESGRPLDQLVGDLMGLAVGSSVILGHAMVNVIDFYLDDERKAEREHIKELVKHQDADSQAILLGYACEAMRLKPQFNGLYRAAAVDAVISQGPNLPPVEIKAGDRIFASFRNAHLDPIDFPNPTSINPRRPVSAWANLNGTGFHKCGGLDFAKRAIVEAVKVVFSLKNVRRAPGDAGVLTGFSEIVNETELDSFVQRNGTLNPFPGSLHITWDA